MMRTMKGRDLLTLSDFTREELEKILALSLEMKHDLKSGNYIRPYLSGKTVILLFQKPSTRTRLSFDVGVHQLGGHSIYLNWNDLQLGRGETIADTARTFDAYADGIVARVFNHRGLEVMAENANAPVINALSDLAHPCQALGDSLTIIEKKGGIAGKNVVFVGDGNNNVCRSLAEAVLKLGGNMTIASPAKYQISSTYAETIKKGAAKGASLTLTQDPKAAVKDADVIYTDVWVSMGQEAEKEERLVAFRPYQVNSELLSLAPPDVIVMHCLPAHRGEEITDEVIDGKNSVVWDQAENRLHAQKGIMALLI
ncbi:MAG: ornithine carbamoyltransferase [Candidatus Methanomethylicaceae archaeon]